VLKSTLLQLDSTFSEREYGTSTFRDFVQRLARAGYVTLKGTDRNIYVELREGTEGGTGTGGSTLPPSGVKEVDGGGADLNDGAGGLEEGLPQAAADFGSPAGTGQAASAGYGSGSSAGHGSGTGPSAGAGAGGAGRASTASTEASPAGGTFAVTDGGATNGIASHAATSVAAGDVGATDRAGAPSAGSAPAADAGAAQAEGARFITEVFHRPGLVSRWPLYLRQVKQILRGVDETFDERRYGFQGLVEALRYCQRDGLFRLDRDRQGVLRVYPGPALPRSVASPVPAADGGSLSPAPDAEDARPRPESRDSHHARSGRDTSSSRDLFAEPEDGIGNVARQESRGSDRTRETDRMAAAAEETTPADASETVGASESTTEAAAAGAEAAAAGAEAPPTQRGSRRRRPGPVAAKPAAKKTAAAPKPRGVKSARARKNSSSKSARGKENDAG
jgi:hypothetical protein